MQPIKFVGNKEQINLLEKITDYVKIKTANNNPIHKYDHAIRVTGLSLWLAENYEVNYLVLQTAALMHDIWYLKAENHEIESAKIAREYLRKLENFPKHLINKVCNAIIAHRFNNSSRKPETIEEKILFDADKLDVLGAIGLARLFKYNPEKEIYCIEDPFAKHRELDEKHYDLDHMLKKAFSIKEKLFLPEAKEEAENRMGILYKFIEELKRELSMLEK